MRLLKVARECKDVGELSNMLNTLGLAATKVGGLMKVREFLKGNDKSIEEFIGYLLDEVTKELPVSRALGRK